MAKKTTNSTTTGAPKTRKPRTPVEKIFRVGKGGARRLVAGFSQRKVEAAVWQRPEVAVATPAEVRELVALGVQIETIEAPVPAAETAGQPGAAVGDGGASADASAA